ncbi:hypothetical protein YC2023_066760 [Brassica napus]
MESGSVSSIDQALPTSVDEKYKFAVYSTAVHKVVFRDQRLSEAIDVNRRFGVTARLVGRTSHLLGGLTASVLISVVCTKLAFVLLILWFCWFSFVAYNTFNEIKINNSRANNTEADSPVRRRFDNS